MYGTISLHGTQMESSMKITICSVSATGYGTLLTTHSTSSPISMIRSAKANTRENSRRARLPARGIGVVL